MARSPEGKYRCRTCIEQLGNRTIRLLQALLHLHNDHRLSRDGVDEHTGIDDGNVEQPRSHVCPGPRMASAADQQLSIGLGLTYDRIALDDILLIDAR